jgi:hypothetical protein
MPICRDFPSAAARQEYHELRGSCQICGKPPNSPLSPEVSETQQAALGVVAGSSPLTWCSS